MDKIPIYWIQTCRVCVFVCVCVFVMGEKKREGLEREGCVGGTLGDGIFYI